MAMPAAGQGAGEPDPRGGRVPPPSRARAHPNHPQEGAPGWVATPP